MATLTRFEDIAALDVARQRDLLYNGKPEERIWAAWALGLTLGKDAVPELRAAFDRDEAVGVRRHLVVILAGLGERPLLGALMADERDDALRATAAQYALQTGETMHPRLLIDTLLRDPSAQVRRALLVADGEVGTVLNVQHLVALAADVDAEVRGMAIEALVLEVPPEELFPGPLEGRISIEPDIYLRGRLMRLAVAGGRARRLLAMAADAPASLTVELLHELVDGGQYFAWSDLAPVVARDIAPADQSLAFLLSDQGSTAATSWLLARLIRSITTAYPPGRSDIERANFSARCYTLLEIALRDIDLPRLSAADRDAMAVIMGDLALFKEQMDEVMVRYPPADPRLDWMKMPHIQVRLRVLERLRTLGVRPRTTVAARPSTGIVPA